MRVMHEMVKTMDIPLERLRFNPDPLEINDPASCSTCHQGKLRIAPSAPVVSPEIREPADEELLAEFALPPFMVWTALLFARVIAYSYIAATSVWAFILGQPRLRVVREEEQA